MKYVGYYFILLFIIFIIMYIINIVIKGKMKRLGDSAGFKYVEKHFDLDMNETRARKLAKILTLNDSIIISIPIYIDIFLFTMDSPLKMILFFILSFVLFVVFILISYKTIGKVLKKKGW